MAKILIVEDDSVLLKTIEEYLIGDEFETICASDGEEAVEAAKKEVPNLVLLDIILPKKDGYEVIKELKATEETKKIPIILLTNLGGVQDVEKALKLGATTYLIKSDYKLEDVVKKIREILNRRP